MAVESRSLKLDTKGKTDIIDITDMIKKQISGLGMTSGILTIFVVGSTGGLTTLEYEPALIADIKNFFESIISSKQEYEHDKTWQDANGYSHIRASLLGPSLTIPFVDKEMTLGTWQQIVFMDFDNRPRSRKLILQFIGE
jgi:secondary thiamine-phosphate synthase enzyme